VSSFPNGTFSQAPWPGDLVHAVQLKVDKFADAQAGRAHQQKRVGAQPVR